MAPGAAYTDHQFRSNAYTGPRPTPTIPKGGLFSIYAETQIPTPPIYPYTALLDLRTWHEWSTYIPDVIITKHPSPHSRSLKMENGTFMTLTYQLTPDVRETSKEVVRHLEALKTRKAGNSSTGRWVTRIRWTSDNAGLLQPGFLGRTERVCEIEETEEGKTVFRTWQSFAGIGAKMVKRKWEKVLQERFEDFVRDLRKRSIVLMKKEGVDGPDLVDGFKAGDEKGGDLEVRKDEQEAAAAVVGLEA